MICRCKFIVNGRSRPRSVPLSVVYYMNSCSCLISDLKMLLQTLLMSLYDALVYIWQTHCSSWSTISSDSDKVVPKRLKIDIKYKIFFRRYQEVRMFSFFRTNALAQLRKAGTAITTNGSSNNVHIDYVSTVTSDCIKQ